MTRRSENRALYLLAFALAVVFFGVMFGWLRV